ncbi:MAG: hypothetical protein Q9222_005435 [Ikaeria aurantiellina]
MTTASTVDDTSLEGSRNPSQDTDHVKLANTSSRSETDSMRFSTVDQSLQKGDMSSNENEWKVLHWMQKSKNEQREGRRARLSAELTAVSKCHSKSRSHSERSWDHTAFSPKKFNSLAIARRESLVDAVPDEDGKQICPSPSKEISDVQQFNENIQAHAVARDESSTKEDMPPSLTAKHDSLGKHPEDFNARFQAVLGGLLAWESAVPAGKTRVRWKCFKLHPKDLVDVRKAPDMPPQARQDEYQYQPSDLLPPVGENLMTHLFHHPHDGNEKAITFLRSPKKRKQKLAICPQKGTNVGWGIHLVEGWAMTKIWLLALAMLFSSSLIFAVSWSVLQHDVQGAFGVASYCIALSGLGIGTIQAHIT